ncbi:hypothetical protein [Pantoea sp.]|uniref:hypothetical protein n=1 Tax=Pantoea sp. TaxID=69393 RepID=UPI0031D70330
MGRFTDSRKDDSAQKIELMVKIILRTDAYLNSANTKSTILLSLSSALLAAILLNYDKFLNRLSNVGDKYVLSVFALASLILLLMAIFYSLKGVVPFLEPSTKKNIFSFVDSIHYHKDVEGYISCLREKNSSEMISSLASLNFTLSKALIDKYSQHKNSVECITIALLTLGLMILVIILSQI